MSATGLSTPSTAISRIPRRSERVQQEARNALALLGVSTPLEVKSRDFYEVKIKNLGLRRIECIESERVTCTHKMASSTGFGLTISGLL